MGKCNVSRKRGGMRMMGRVVRFLLFFRKIEMYIINYRVRYCVFCVLIVV